MKIDAVKKGSTRRVVLRSKTEGLPETLHDAEVLLFVPPFYALGYPSLAVHLLQACGREAGFRVQVFYANLLLASVIGEESYTKIWDAPEGSFAGERFFARCAFGLPPLGRRVSRMFEPDWVIGPDRNWEVRPDVDSDDGKQPITLRELRRLERFADGYLDDIARAVGEKHYRIVGCTATFAQTAASVALLNRIKALSSDTVTILGGPNCEGEMARGIASLPCRVDYIFSGESEETFPAFVKAVLAGERPRGRVLEGEPCKDLDALPTPLYREFFEQRKRFLPMSQLPAAQVELPYETSRGCWWGQKHHCTFCGFNEEAIAFRQKSPDRIIEDLRAYLNAHPTRKVVMADSIMPHTFFKSLLPRLPRELPGASLFFEIKANLSLTQLLALKRAGITSIQPGIESLSSRLLSLMRKGVQARQNLMLLRNARAVGMDLTWNLLWGFPGDEAEAYGEMLCILPLIHHLQPPDAMAHLSIDRFSPYFFSPAEFGVRNITPLAGFHDFLPDDTDVARIAYHFTGEYESDAHDRIDVIQKLWREIAQWQEAWKQENVRPKQDLTILRKDGSYVLVDTRDLWKRKRSYPLDETEASVLVTARPYSGSEIEGWALREKLALVADGWFVPLAVADPRMLLELSGEPGCAQLPLAMSNADKADLAPEVQVAR